MNLNLNTKNAVQCDIIINQINIRLEQIKKIQSEIDELRIKLEEICEHAKIISINDYFPGNYYDNARTRTTYKCDICGKQFAQVTDIHKWR